MSNAELIERLRHNPTLDLFAEAANALAAANKRIAELERKLAVAREALNTIKEWSDTFQPHDCMGSEYTGTYLSLDGYAALEKVNSALAQIGGEDASS